jgi:hypothetical protein
MNPPRGVPIPAAAMQKVMVVPFADGLALSTSGGGTTWEYVELDDALGHLRSVGPFLETITAHTKTAIRTTNARWKLVFWWSVDGNTWTGPIDLFGELAAVGQAIQTAYTPPSPSTLGLQLRFGIGIRAAAGTASESVNVSGSLVLVFKV